MNRLVGICMAVVLTAPPAIAGNVGVVSSHRIVRAERQVVQQTVQQGMQQLMSIYTPQQLEDGVYVGSEFCIACHSSFAGFRDTLHRKQIRTARPDTLVNDFNRNGINDFEEGLDFNQISSAFDQYKPNAPVLGSAGGQYTITIGGLTMPVVAAEGGEGWKQLFLVRVPVTGTADGLTADNYLSPIQYTLATGEYAVYAGDNWYDADDEPRFQAGLSAASFAGGTNSSYSKSCIGCHVTGIQSLTQDGNGEWRADLYPGVLFQPGDPTYLDLDHDGNTDLTNVGCESCHGPGSGHILGGGDPSKIVNPKNLTTAEENALCGQCHIRSKSVPGGVHGFPYDEAEQAHWIPGSGEDFQDYWTDNASRWPDGVNSRKSEQQWQDFYESSKPTYPYHPVRCSECHEPHHVTANEHQVIDSLDEGGLLISISTDNNTLCLACHATHGPFEDITPDMVADYGEYRDEIGSVISAHTHHPYAPERTMGLSRCTTCHMPKVATSAVAFDIHSHTFEPIAPEKTLMYQDQGGMPNACGVSCHSQKVNLWGFGISPDITVWDSAFEVQNANQLMQYFGPGGLWWDTTASESLSRRFIESSAAPGVVPVDSHRTGD